MATEEVERPCIYLIDPELQALCRSAASRLNADLVALDPTKPFEVKELSRPASVVAILDPSSVSFQSLVESAQVPGSGIPVFYTVHQQNFDDAVYVMERGAFTVLTKPIDVEVLTPYLAAGFAFDRDQWQLEKTRRETNSLLASLSQRQSTILDWVVMGRSTRWIARELNVSQRLVEKERSKILKIFGVASTPDVTLRIGESRILNSVNYRFDPKYSAEMRSSVLRRNRKSTDCTL